MMISQQCSECGAQYVSDSQSCLARFEELLALDHSRREPWGSRHGQAFAAFALQHPIRHRSSLDAAWVALYRIYCRNESPSAVFTSIRHAGGRPDPNSDLPSRPLEPIASPRLTIVDLGDFAATTYAARLDEWCRATLIAWGATFDVAAA